MSVAARHLANDASPRRAIGIIRVSQTKGREGERFASPEEQRDRIETLCEREGLQLIDTLPEMDVSGGTPLAKRGGLRHAVEMIEARQADVIVCGYFDRLVRSIKVQAEVVERVEAAGGGVLLADFGRLTNGSAAQWFSGTIMGAVSEYFRRSAKERSAEGQARAVARGATPWARVPVGYRRRDDGTLEPDPEQVPVARRAFEMRAAGESIGQIWKMLRSHGIERSHRGVQVMLASRVYLGEIHFGELVNLRAHEPIIERELWRRVQRMRVPRGPKSSSDRLLARLGVLRCGSCGARMSAMKLPKQDDYPIYRCPSTSDCPRHVTISAVVAEQVVSDAVRKALSDAEGRARLAGNSQEAARALEGAQVDLDAAIRSFTAAGLQNESAAIERLAELRQARDDTQAQVDRLGNTESALTVNADDDWDEFSLEARRALIQAVVKRAVVAPGVRGRRGPEYAASRITIELASE